MKNKPLVFLTTLIIILSILYFVYQKKTKMENPVIEFLYLPQSTVDSIIMKYNGR